MLEITEITDALDADIEIKHPVTGEPIGAVFTMAGPEHPVRKALEFAKQRKVRKTFEKTQKIELGDPEDDAMDQIERLAKCTLGWKGITENGVAVEFTPTAALKLYGTEGLGWLREQLLTAMTERDRFIKACAKA